MAKKTTKTTTGASHPPYGGMDDNRPVKKVATKALKAPKAPAKPAKKFSQVKYNNAKKKVFGI